MDKQIYLKAWKNQDDKVLLIYKDNSTLLVNRSDFNRAFACMESCPKDIIQRDFSISKG